MTQDERFEREVAAVVREGAPAVAPPALRRRVESSMRLATTGGWARRRATLFAAAAGVIVLLVAAAIVAPRLVPEVPGATKPGSSLPATGIHSPSATAPPAATVPPIAEPITDPGQVQIGELLTAIDGWVHNTDGHLFLTHSGGAAWRDVTPSGITSDILRPFFVDPIHGWLSEYDENADTGLVLWRTTDAGVTWSRFVVPDVQAVNWDLVFLTPMVGWLASDPGGQKPKPELRWTDDGGSTWSAPINLTAATGIDTLQGLTFADREHGFLTGDDLFRWTRDGGMTWSDVILPPDLPAVATEDGDLLRFAPPRFVDARHGFLVVDVIAPDGTFRTRLIYVTVTGGVPLGDPPLLSGFGWRLALRDDLRRQWAFVDEGTWIGIDGEQVWATRDGGATFDVQGSVGLPTPLDRAWMTFVDPEHAWGAAVRGGCPAGSFGCFRGPELFATPDGGRTWTRLGDCIFVCPSGEPR